MKSSSLMVIPAALLTGWGACLGYSLHRVEQAWDMQQAAYSGIFPRVTVAARHVRPTLTGLAVDSSFDVLLDPCSQKTAHLVMRETIHPTLLFGSGVVRSTIDLDPDKTDQSLKSLFHDREPLTITGEYRAEGKTSYHFNSPAAQGALDGWDVSWRGLEADVRLDPKGSEFSLTSRGLNTSKEGTASFNLDDLALKSHSVQQDSGVRTGEYELKVADLDVRPENSKRFSMSDTVLHSKLDGKGDTLGWNMVYTIGDIRVGDQFSGRGDADISVVNMNAAAMKRFTDAFNAAVKQCKPDPQQAAEAMTALLAGGPELVLNRLELDWEQNRLKLSGRLKGIPSLAAGKDPSALAEAARHLETEMTLTANEVFLNKFNGVASGPTGGGVLAQASALPYREFMRRDGNDYVLQFAIKNGQVSLNGQPWNEVISNYRLNHPEPVTSVQNPGDAYPAGVPHRSVWP